MHGAGARRGGVAGPERASDVYPLAARTVLACAAAAIALVLATGARWESPALDLPLGAWLAGGAGGALTILLAPSWSRRLGSRNRGLVVACSLYRLASALILGGLGYLAITELRRTMGLEPPEWFQFALAFGCGILESFVNEVALRALGFLAPREIDPRLL